MNQSRLRSFSTSRIISKTNNNNAATSTVPFDIANLNKVEFNFPLTRDNILKVEHRRKILNYLRLEQTQFIQLGK
jgi:hypothetical protein